MTRTPLHAHCAVVKPTTTMRAQNYAGSGITCGSCWKCSSVCIIHTTV